MSKRDKPVLVLVPGLGETAETFAPLIDRLQKEYDVRVAMHSLKLPRTIDRDFFFAAIDRAAGSAKSFKLLGHSMGGAIALAYAARHPQRVRRVAAVASPVTPRREFGFHGLTRFRTWRRLQNLGLGIRSGHPLHALKAVRIRTEVLADGRRQRLYDWVNHLDLRKDLPKLRSARVLWMKNEEVLYRDHLDAVRQHSNIRVKEIRGSHNYLPLFPRAIYRDVREALDD